MRVKNIKELVAKGAKRGLGRAALQDALEAVSGQQVRLEAVKAKDPALHRRLLHRLGEDREVALGEELSPGEIVALSELGELRVPMETVNSLAEYVSKRGSAEEQEGLAAEDFRR